MGNLTPEQQQMLVAKLSDMSNDDAAAVAKQSALSSPKQGESAMTKFRRGMATGTEMLIPFSGTAKMAKQRAESGEDINFADRQVIGLGKGITFGLLGTIGAASEELGARIAGTDDKTFKERRTEFNEAINPNAGLLGELVGSMVGGPKLLFEGAEAGVKYGVPKLATMIATRGPKGVAARASVSALLGGSETFAYSLAAGKDVQGAAQDAKLGAFGGAGMSMAGDALKGGVRLLRKYNFMKDRPDVEVTQALLDRMKAEYGDDFVKNVMGTQQLDVDALARYASDEDTLVTKFPRAVLAEVDHAMKTSQKHGNAGMFDALRPLNNYLLNQQKAALPQFKDAVNSAIDANMVRTQDDLILQMRELRAGLQPQYDAALRNATRTGAKIKVADVHKIIDNKFRSLAKVPAYRRIRDHLKASVGPEKVSTKRGTRNNYLTPTQFLELRKALDDDIFNGRLSPVGKEFTETASLQKSVLRNAVMPARNSIRQLLYEVAPELAELDTQFADNINMNKAFEAGVDIFKGKGATSKAMDVFETASTSRTPAETAAFIEGIKRQLLDDMAGKTSPKQVENYLAKNADKFELVANVVGQDAAQKIQRSLGKYAQMAEIGSMAKNAAGPQLSYDGPNIGGLVDVATMLGSATGALSKALGAGAGRRQAAALGKELQSGNVGLAQMLSDVSTMPLDDAARMLNRVQQQQIPQLMRGIPGIAPVAED